MPRADTILILGSAPDVVRAREWRREGIDAIVAINNAWKVRSDWDRLVHPKDFPLERRPADPRPWQSLHSYPDYVPAVNAYGGFVFCGGTMAFTTAYWALHALRPRLMAFLGCDMTYAANGPTHFYGAGTADPMRPDPTLQSLEAKSARFQLLAAEQGCAVVNLSENKQSRLVFPRLGHTALPAWTEQDSRTLCMRLLDPRSSARVAEARARETALGYDVPSGKYWKEFGRFDAQALRRVDALWRSAAPDYSVAA